ncbi:RhoGAP domain containing protein [Entamoeba marina]
MNTTKTTRLSMKLRRFSFREKKDSTTLAVIPPPKSTQEQDQQPLKYPFIKQQSQQFTTTGIQRDSFSKTSSQLKSSTELNLIDSTNSFKKTPQSAPNTPGLSPTYSPSKGRDLSYKNRRMSWKSKNLSEEKRDISLIAMDEQSPDVLSGKELKALIKEEDKRQKLLQTTNPLKKCEIILDIQCLSTHRVVALKKSFRKTVMETTMKYLKKTTKEIVLVDKLVFRSATGKILSKNMTLRGILTLDSTCIFVCYNDRPFTLQKIYPSVITSSTKRIATPQVVFNMCWWIYTYGYLVEGIFRVSGDSEIVRKRVEQCLEGDTTFLSQMHNRTGDVHNVIGILKMYLREKTDGLVNYDLVRDVSSNMNNSFDFAVKVLKEIPRENLLCFSILYGLIQRLIKYDSIHLMTSKNFAMILGPLIIHPQPGMNAINSTCNQLDFSNMALNNYDAIVASFGLSNPFAEYPQRDDLKKFDSKEVNHSLTVIKNMELETPAECERLKKHLENPNVIHYLNEMDAGTLIDVISVIIEGLSD